jgi:hypothetical protein
MNRFLVLYNSPTSSAEMMASATPDQMQEGMDAWNAWAQKVGDALVDFGLPLGSNRRVGGDDSMSQSQANGYSIVQADSLDDAAKMLEDHPHLRTEGGTIDVFECLPMPGM